MGRSDEIAREANQILEPHRLESQLRTELTELSGNVILEEVIASYDGYWCLTLFILSAQTPKEAEAVDERHSKIQNDGVGPDFLSNAQAAFGVDGCTNVVPLQPQHAGKRLGHALIVVDDEDFLSNGRGFGC